MRSGSVAREMQCQNNLKQIGLALLNYESAYKRLPVAVETSDEGRLWRSWRSVVYPTFLEQSPRFYDDSVAWDAPTNLRLIDGTEMSIPTDKGGETTVLHSLDPLPWCFACPSAPARNGVSYVVVTGQGTAFPEGSSIRLDEITDGLENTILAVESVTCSPKWTEPRDLNIATMSFRINTLTAPSISSFHPMGANVCFADLSVFLLTPELSESEVRALITIAGGEKVQRDTLVGHGLLVER